ncbi:MAG TPA: DUF1428 domain-containing protein [Hyphomicrobiaceae bacterium]|nr:DUF1428 domain-containing protein [Hyphomicrobiaceae bacterium]
MPRYVDGFVIPVPKKKLAAYLKLAETCAEIWREYGALEVRECVADDVKIGKLTSFPRSVQRKPSETVIFSWILYKSRADRDRINAKVMKDARMVKMMEEGKDNVPFDSKRMIFGGFGVMVEA